MCARGLHVCVCLCVCLARAGRAQRLIVLHGECAGRNGRGALLQLENAQKQ